MRGCAFVQKGHVLMTCLYAARSSYFRDCSVGAVFQLYEGLYLF